MRQYNLETASKVTTNETKMTLKNLMGYMKYNIQVRAATIEPGPWTNILPLMTPTQGWIYLFLVLFRGLKIMYTKKACAQVVKPFDLMHFACLFESKEL